MANIVTDPPYGREHLGVYGLVAMVGQYHLPRLDRRFIGGKL